MRRCLLKTIEQWSPIELPLLPFLAPRISAPWLFDQKPRRKHSSAASQRSTSYLLSDDNRPSGGTSKNNVFKQQCLFVPRRMQLSQQACPSRSNTRALHSGHQLSSQTQHGLVGSVLAGSTNMQQLDAEYVHEEKTGMTKEQEYYNLEDGSGRGYSLETSLFEPEDDVLADEEDDFEKNLALEDGQDIDIDSPHASVADMRSELQRLRGLMPQELDQRKDVEAQQEQRLKHARAEARRGRSRRAMQILLSLIEAGLEPSDARVLRICSIMLRRSKTSGGQYQDSSSIIAAISEAGVQLNLTMFNVLILNAAETNDPGTAWRIWQLLGEQDVQPDDYTYTILLSMCRRLNDKENYSALLRKLRPKTYSRGAYLLTEIMACRYHFTRQGEKLALRAELKEQDFMRVLQFYELHFDLQPLRTLGIVTPEIERDLKQWVRNENMPKQKPLAATLAIVLRAFVRQSQRQDPVREVYRHFRSAIHNFDPSIIPLIETTHAYNIFLKALCRTTSTLKHWRMIIGDMNRPFPAGLQQRLWSSETGHIFEPAKPDLQSWNIVLNAYAQCASKSRFATIWGAVVDVQGHVPDVVSWNARLQSRLHHKDVKLFSRDLLEMVDTDIVPNEYTQKLMTRYEGQQALQSSIVDALEARMRTLRFRADWTHKEVPLSTFPYVDVTEYVKSTEFGQKRPAEQIHDLLEIAKATSYLMKPRHSIEIRKLANRDSFSWDVGTYKPYWKLYPRSDASTTSEGSSRSPR